MALSPLEIKMLRRKRFVIGSHEPKPLENQLAKALFAKGYLSYIHNVIDAAGDAKAVTSRDYFITPLGEAAIEHEVPVIVKMLKEGKFTIRSDAEEQRRGEIANELFARGYVTYTAQVVGAGTAGKAAVTERDYVITAAGEAALEQDDPEIFPAEGG